MNEFRVVSADQANESRLNHFLSRFYSRAKSDFLRQHGSWWHRGHQNRLVVVRGDEIAAYCAVIPLQCLIRGSKHPALWWIDLIVAPEFRSRGLQALLDKEVRKAADLKLGFPNELAAKIHRKHGWGVREDFHSFLLPLRPLKVKSIRKARGVRRLFLQLFAVLLTPVAAIFRRIAFHYKPRTARLINSPCSDILAKVFEQSKNDMTVTTYRDQDFIHWRYFDSPFRSQLSFYSAGPWKSPALVLIARTMNSQGTRVMRILDVFGDFRDKKALRDIIKAAVKNAVLERASQMTAMASLPELASALRSAGFLIRAKARFCWHSTSQDTMQSLLESPRHWSLADSDNDEPD